MNPLLWLMVPLAPLIAAILLLSMRQRLQQLTPWLGLACLPAILFSLLPPDSFVPQWIWPDANWSVDAVTRPWLMFTALLWGVAGFYAAYSQREDDHLLRFWVFWLVALAGNLLLIIAQDALSFYVGFSMMSLSAYGLVVHSGKPLARRAGRLYLQLAILGEILLFTGMALRAYYADGSWSFSDWLTISSTPLSTALLLVGLGLKAGFWPLHVWLPLAHPVAPAPASAVLSGAMLKAGILGLWQFLPGVAVAPGEWGLQLWATTVMGVAIISILLGAAIGVTRRDAKEALAWSSVSQMGFLLFAIALGWHLPEQRVVVGAALTLYVVHHGFAKGALFLAADVFKSATPVSALQKKLILMALTVPALALAGLPLSSGAAAKTALKALLDDPSMSVWLIALTLGAVGTMLVVARACFLLAHAAHHAPAHPHPRPALWAWLMLCTLPLLTPWLWPAMRGAAVDSLLWYKWVELGWPIVIGLAMAVIGRQLARNRDWHVPDWLAQSRTPFQRLSLQLKRRLYQPLLPPIEITWSSRLWRQRERRWNRIWRGHTVNRSAAILVIFIIVAGLAVFRTPVL